MVKLRNITVNYSTNILLENISISFQSMSVIYGDSGVGKTTLLNVIAGNKKYSTGNIEYDNISHDEILLISGDSILYSELTVYENLEYLLCLKDIKLNEEKVAYYFDKLQLSCLLRKKVKYLSGGERQRVMIIYAFLSKPKILLLDEPTSALNYDLKQNVLSLLLEEFQNSDRMLIITTHDKFLIGNSNFNLMKIINKKIIKERIVSNENTKLFLQETLKISLVKKMKCFLKVEYSIYKSYLTALFIIFFFSSMFLLLFMGIGSNTLTSIYSDYINDENIYMNKSSGMFTHKEITSIEKNYDIEIKSKYYENFISLPHEQSFKIRNYDNKLQLLEGKSNDLLSDVVVSSGYARENDVKLNDEIMIKLNVLKPSQSTQYSRYGVTEEFDTMLSERIEIPLHISGIVSLQQSEIYLHEKLLDDMLIQYLEEDEYIFSNLLVSNTGNILDVAKDNEYIHLYSLLQEKEGIRLLTRNKFVVFYLCIIVIMVIFLFSVAMVQYMWKQKRLNRDYRFFEYGLTKKKLTFILVTENFISALVATSISFFILALSSALIDANLHEMYYFQSYISDLSFIINLSNIQVPLFQIQPIMCFVITPVIIICIIDWLCYILKIKQIELD